MCHRMCQEMSISGTQSYNPELLHRLVYFMIPSGVSSLKSSSIGQLLKQLLVHLNILSMQIYRRYIRAHASAYELCIIYIITSYGGHFLRSPPLKPVLVVEETLLHAAAPDVLIHNVSRRQLADRGAASLDSGQINKHRCSRSKK